MRIEDTVTTYTETLCPAAEHCGGCIYQGVPYAEQYSANLKAYFDRIKTVDADGVRTPEEVAMLDEYIKQSVQKYDATHTFSKPQTEKTNFAVTAAIKKGRER